MLEERIAWQNCRRYRLIIYTAPPNFVLSKLFIQEIELMVGERMGVKAIYESNVLRPLGKLDLKEGEVVEIEIKKDAVDRLAGMVKISRQDWIDELIESPELEPI